MSSTSLTVVDQQFRFENEPVRIVMRNEQPWFVLADVCRVLAIGNPSDAANRLDEDEKHTLDNIEGIADARVQALVLISESGLYALILTSRKTAAKRFKKWVTAEVLPSIRKTGSYGSPVPVFNVRDPASLLALSAELALALSEQNAAVQTLEANVAALAPKAAAWSRIADTTGVITITNFAKTAGIGPKWLATEYLPNVTRWCYRRRESHSDRIGPLIAYQEIVDRGWMVHKLAEFMRSNGSVGTRDQVYLTPAGAAKLAELLEKRKARGGTKPEQEAA